MATRVGPRVRPGSSERFIAAVQELDNGTPVVSVMGEVDLATAPALGRMLLSVTEERTGEVIVDLSCCSFFDSSGLTALNETRTRLGRSNRGMALVMSKPNVMKVFQITGFDKRFTIYPSLSAADDAGAAAHV